MSMVVLTITTITIMLKITPGIQERCPPIESEVYQVTVMSSGSSTIDGCAYINYNSSDIIQQSFSLWFGDQHGEQRCRDHVTHKNYYFGMKYLHFYCLTKSLLLSEDVKNERLYIKLYDEDSNMTERSNHRCALYEMANENAATFRIAISRHDSCVGLLDVLSRPQLMIPENNKEYIFLLFNKTKLDETTTSPVVDMTTTESIESIAKRYERRGYILQNFGNRPNPFRKTKRSAVIQDSNKSFSTQSNANDNVDITKTTTPMDKDKPHQRSSIVVMQQLFKLPIKRRRSFNATSNLCSDITGFSWIQCSG
ncbi:uncharacterized protein LOC112603758 [Melanaphis sacchari]|uniref:uncharacterized protein LOC112603758 n=1 Tax=Melanaphis sacchari TaxID=742174 RepID=UPI000DC1543D|nr:uncharacterized protein LOC112603758 [Melanaphis sacchari]